MIKIMTYRSDYIFSKRPELVEYLENNLNNYADVASAFVGSGMFSDLTNERPMIMFVAWDCGKPVGWTSVTFNLCDVEAGQISCYVAPNYRRQGVGSRLVKKAKIWCKTHNLIPRCNTWNEAGYQFYSQNGIPEKVAGWCFYDYRGEIPV